MSETSSSELNPPLKHILTSTLPYSYENNNAAIIQVLQTAGKIIQGKEGSEIQKDVLDILSGRLGGIEITRPYGRGDPVQKTLKKRERLLQLYEKDSELARIIVQKRIAGFHGSYSGSLSGFLAAGGELKALSVLSTDGPVHTGERGTLSQAVEDQLFVSFADWKDQESLGRYASLEKRPITEVNLQANIKSLAFTITQAEKMYGELDSSSPLMKRMANLKAELRFLEENRGTQIGKLFSENFPVLYGITTDGLTHDMGMNGTPPPKSVQEIAHGDIKGEFTVMHAVPHANLPVIATIKEKQSKVKEILAKAKLDGIDVIAAEPLVVF